MLSDDDIKQVFFHCSHESKDGYYADNVDILEFGNKVAAFVAAKQKPMTEEQIMDFMFHVKLDENGQEFFPMLVALIRSIEKLHGIE